MAVQGKQGAAKAAANGKVEPGVATAPGPDAGPAIEAGAPVLSPEMMARVDALRSSIQLSVGQIVLAVMNLARYRHQTIGDLTHLLIEPLLRDRVAIAHRQVKGADGAGRVDEASVAGIAIWATVSDAVDAGITEQVKAGVFPVRLGAGDWRSGENVWLLDVIAGGARAATSVLANFRQLAGERVVKIHPMVGRLIEPEALERLRGGAKA